MTTTTETLLTWLVRTDIDTIDAASIPSIGLSRRDTHRVLDSARGCILADIAETLLAAAEGRGPEAEGFRAASALLEAARADIARRSQEPMGLQL